MTLPGLSGSLLILILGNYNLLLVDCVNGIFFMLKDVFSGDGFGLDDPERKRLLWVFVYFTAGSTLGLILSKLLEQLIKHYKSITISTLVGFILGSLGAVWPWTAKTTLEESTVRLLFSTPQTLLFSQSMDSGHAYRKLFYTFRQLYSHPTRTLWKTTKNLSLAYWERKSTIPFPAAISQKIQTGKLAPLPVWQLWLCWSRRGTSNHFTRRY